MRRRAPFEPIVFYDPYRLVNDRSIGIERNDAGFILCVGWSIPKGCVVDFVVEEGQLGSRYIVVDAVQDTVHLRGIDMRRCALLSGATPEAIRLMRLIMPTLTEKEVDQMAEKLKAKGAGKTADTAALKEAAKKAPVAKSAAKPAEEPKKNKGNPEALEKARAARAVPDRKYKALVKPKDLTLREGTWTRYMVETILAHKDTASAKEAHKAGDEFTEKSLDFKWAEAKGFIEF